MAELPKKQGHTILLYSADMEGHREVYCRVIADFLLECGCAVIIAGNLRSADGSTYARLEPLSKHPRAHFVDTTPEPPRPRVLDHESLSRLMRTCGASAIVLTEADANLSLLTDQLLPGKPRLPGRRVGIFLRSTNYIHADPQRRSLRRRLSGGRKLATTWRRDPRLFHELLLPRFKLLDSALCLDEVFVAAKGGRHAWLPDIFRVDGEPEGHDARLEGEWLVRLEEFTRAQAGRPLLVYYGTARRRRGYDSVLRLADAEGACFVHCGRRDVPDADEPDVRAILDRLRRSGRLLETERTIRRFDIGERFLSASDCVILPYRAHLGSSGVMLQALQAHRPVLVPDVGLMAERTRRNGLGMTYRHDDFEDLRRVYRCLHAQGPGPYQPGIDRFLGSFDRSHVEDALCWALGWTDSRATNPVQGAMRSAAERGSEHVR